MKPTFILYHLAGKKAADRRIKETAYSIRNLKLTPCVVG
jgi:hypothetical protein